MLDEGTTAEHSADEAAVRDLYRLLMDVLKTVGAHRPAQDRG